MSELSMGDAENFLRYVNEWFDGLAPVTWQDLEREAGGVQHIAVFCVDLINGFCKQGNLASERVGAIVPAIARLFARAYERGVRRFILPQDCHPVDSPQFAQYGAHAVCGTEEAETVQELKDLPFADLYQVMPKRSINSAIGTDLEGWLEREGTPRVPIVSGDCTDLCVYQLAMHLKLRANARGEQCMVVVPCDCVDTYEVTVEAAQRLGIAAHPGELLHRLFLYHMMLNGIRVVQRIE